MPPTPLHTARAGMGTMAPNRQNSLKHPVVLGLITIAVLSAFYMFVGRAPPKPTCPPHDKTYGVMFDAGSTGSRVHVYTFSGKKGDLSLDSELFEQLKPGLSGEYKSHHDSKRAVQSIVPLLNKAIERVPESQRRCTPVSLKATAGLRLLGKAESTEILNEAKKLFAESPFHLSDVSLMAGEDEGIFGWITVNFLLENLGSEKKQTAAIIDMGGGSTQIVFEPKELPSDAPRANAYNLKYNGRQFNLYQQSHLGFGLQEAKKKITKLGTCKEEFGACFSAAKQVLDKNKECARKPCSFNGVWQPPLTAFAGNLYAFSYYYDKMESTLPENGQRTVANIKEHAEATCGQDAEKCMELAWLYSVVSTGYDLPDSQLLHIKKKIKGVETAWCLGAVLADLDRV